MCERFYAEKTLFKAVILGAMLVAPVFVSAAPAAPEHASPKKANFYLKWTVSDAEARELARWDIVILDMEVQGANPGALKLMRQINPQIKILAYVTASEIRSDADNLGNAAPLRRELFSSIPSSWYVTDAAGAKRSFWSRTWIVNVTDRAPIANGERWNYFLPRFVRDRIWSTGLWDGVMYDNGWENISYFAGGPVDLNRDGKAETTADADAAWRDGLRQVFRNTRALLPDALVLENDGPYYAPDVNGLQLENFPNGGWASTMGKAAKTVVQAIPPRVLIVNSNTANSGERDDYGKFRFGLASTLLVDGYYGFDYGDQNHGQTWWYDEYGASLGVPSGEARRLDGAVASWRTGIWRRDFSRGAALVNSGTTAKTVKLGSEFERLHGSQDANVNDGVVMSSVTLEPGDGIVLLKPLGDIRGAAVPNGSYARIFAADGQVKRTGFFVSSERFAGDAVMATRVALGRNREIAAAEAGRVRVFDSGYRLLADFRPFGPGSSGQLSIVFVERGNGTDPALAVAGADSGGGVVKTYSLSGVFVREFRSFGKGYVGGIDLAAGDVDGDGKTEIVVGAGVGGGPHVRIFDSDGQLESSGFFAYAAKFRGGVRVAVGDLDGDGKAEIVTGAGKTGGPHVRVFDGKGKLKSEFFAFDRGLTAGIWVGVSDVDADGRTEIVAFTKDLGGLGQ